MKTNAVLFVLVATAMLLASCEKDYTNNAVILTSKLKYKVDGQYREQNFSDAYIYDETYNNNGQNGHMLKLTGSSGSNAFAIIINDPGKITKDVWYSNATINNTGNYFTFLDDAGKEFSTKKNPLGLPQSFRCKFDEITLNKGNRSNYYVSGNFEAVVYYQPTPTTVEKKVFTEGQFIVSGSK